MQISILSFGFKHGLPQNAELLTDVRFIPNPYYVPELKELDGRNERVRQFVCEWLQTQKFLDNYFALIEYLIPLYEKEGKTEVTIAFGCTGGRHRSVVIAQEISTRLNACGQETSLIHRDIDLL